LLTLLEHWLSNAGSQKYEAALRVVKDQKSKQGKVFLPTRLVFDALLVSARKNSKLCLLGGPAKFSTSKAELKGS
jgi:hypothetical protein